VLASRTCFAHLLHAPRECFTPSSLAIRIPPICLCLCPHLPTLVFCTCSRCSRSMRRASLLRSSRTRRRQPSGKACHLLRRGHSREGSGHHASNVQSASTVGALPRLRALDVLVGNTSATTGRPSATCVRRGNLARGRAAQQSALWIALPAATTTTLSAADDSTLYGPRCSLGSPHSKSRRFTKRPLQFASLALGPRSSMRAGWSLARVTPSSPCPSAKTRASCRDCLCF
jgi:hypothetical protein